MGKFLQSINDFPLTVNLEKKTPIWELSRWRDNKSLRFIPLEMESYTLRGNKRRFEYNGRGRTHRFTVLSNKAFEYDCVILREPESNVVTLLMEGAERFDFFRQPDFAPDPFLKGSYAVYKKNTLLGEGTGKLCHIHRPLIIDARGRRCWGDLSVAGNELRITIPEQWLGEAKYPVTVDPTIGTTTVGSQTQWKVDPDEPLETIYFELLIPVNRFLASATITDLCTAYFYTNRHDSDGGGRAVIYSDNGDKPLARKSAEETFVDLRFVNGSNAGWRTGTFKTGGIASGTYIWFGLLAEYVWYPRFDYGAKCYCDSWEDHNSAPNTYPLWNANNSHDLKLSMYFTYSSGQNYARTLTQGVTLSDLKNNSTAFKRSNKETAHGIDNAKINFVFFLVIAEITKLIDNVVKLKQIPRIISGIVSSDAKINKSVNHKRLKRDAVQPTGNVFKGLLITVKILTRVFIRDFLIKRFLIAKDEIILKSKVTKNISFESKPN